MFAELTTAIKPGSGVQTRVFSAPQTSFSRRELSPSAAVTDPGSQIDQLIHTKADEGSPLI